MSYYVEMDIHIRIKARYRKTLRQRLAKWRAIAAKEDIYDYRNPPPELALCIEIDEGNGEIHFAEGEDVQRGYYVEDFADWIKRYCEAGGRLVAYSREGDAEAWGYQFNGKGQMRRLALVPVGKWR